MCILFFAINRHPKYPVIICANRDEFHQRPTQPMHQWQNINLLAGKDLEAGGTWLGINSTGAFSALTNFRQGTEIAPHKKSRGDLVLKAIASTKAETDSYLLSSLGQYNGYNLIYGQLNDLHCFDSVNQKSHAITNGFHSISNGALDDIWPKMEHGQTLLEDAILTDETLSIDNLFAIMKNQQTPHESRLPNTGIEKNWEQLLSSIFIVSPEYGTRSTSIITLDNKNNIKVYEHIYDVDGNTESKKNFSLPSDGMIKVTD